MKKKLLITLIAVCTMLFVFGIINASATSSGTCGDNLTWTLDDEGTLYINGTGNMDEWVLYPFQPWYDYHSLVNKVIIEEGVKTIAGDAFSFCENLSEIIIPNSVVKIGVDAFVGCENLIKVNIPESVEKIEDGAFSHCEKLEEINVSHNNDFYSTINGDLYDKDGTTILQYAMGKAEQRYETNYNLKEIGDNAFEGCDLTEIVIVSSNDLTIGRAAFLNCSNLKKVVIKHGVTEIGDLSFQNCKQLEEVELPSSIKSIGNDAFRFCSNLQNASYKGTKEQWNLVYVGYRNEALLEILQQDIGGKLGNDLSWSLDDGLLNITGIGEMPNFSNYNETPWYQHRGEIKKIVINDGITSIGNFSFGYCSRLREVELPISITRIGDNAFCYCDFLTDIILPQNIEYLGECAFYQCERLKKIVIPDGIASIKRATFAYCFNLSEIMISKNVVSIGSFAFDGCGMKNITIPNSAISIDDYAFVRCGNLESVSLFNSVVKIGNNAFLDCANLTDIFYTGSENEWEKISIGNGNIPLTIASVTYLTPCTSTNVSKNGFDFNISLYNIETGKTVILTLYNDETLVEMQFAICEDGVIPFTTTKIYTNAKVIVWDDLTKLKPVCGVEIVK